MNINREHQCDVLVIGSGAAGLSLALQVAPYGKVIILSKSSLNEGATYYAQGGIAAVFDESDSIESHIQDTKIAGAGLCEDDTVKFIANNAKPCVQWLIDNGVLFDREENNGKKPRYHLTQEGGHSHRRILHSADTTGMVMQNSLQNNAYNHSNITILEYCNAIDLITEDKIGGEHNKVVGAYIWNRRYEYVENIRAQFIVLATGGASKVYQYTSNPDISSGDGIAMAWRAGCRVANLEFNQFHPTCLFHPKAKNLLLTEALRGEGAYLKRIDGTRFMIEFDKRAELAPRDIVARAIDFEMKRLGEECMYLDITHKSIDFIKKHFPSTHIRLQNLCIDMTKELIPIVPAAHYTCGGIIVNQKGQTDLSQLYAIGEVSYTGLHGANRIASNSLLECIVYAWSASQEIIKKLRKKELPKKLPEWDDSQVTCSDEEIVIQHNWRELRLLMWDYMGIVRTNKRLARALRRIELLQKEICEYYSNFKVSNNLLELRNLLQVSELMVQCAMKRKESRGLHYTLDYPELQNNTAPTILIPKRKKY
ncbi:L-aspartate oxidase [Candidatus Photodesmus anomalopis]|uniref:L-aspartate oxidase n=1 Tax=Candidatus Photodesmus katoptron Akat1 TaxID=1236703 RepID=S3DI13_9GAMM|nr:L-aspartate oxidase [Candidatus Photodesmus katoptron]EPE37315.1 L-aspartate oxidase [Candidatus Photodesmus katoptron Akat1]